MRDQSYVARFGWTRRDLLLLPACVLFVVAGIALATAGGHPVWGVLTTLLSLAYVVLWILAVLSRRAAFAVTADGIVLGQLPPRPVSGTAFVPWTDIEAVILWRQPAGRTTVDFVGLQRRTGAPPLPGSTTSPAMRRLNRAVVPAIVPDDVIADSRPITFWRLDKRRLADAIDQFAPQVRIVDHTSRLRK
ncbi:hypothetical protein [Dactylosporangium salmoneum]|uniref:PH domain-containing protein n=1 Tax=Dactylosporangium salmoneum TaxID=53361 RepID=A0ABP5UEW0_9ACTN